MPVRAQVPCPHGGFGVSVAPATLRIMTDGLSWIQDALREQSFELIAVRDAGVEELAVMLGGRPGTVMDPPAFNALVAAAGTAWRLPDLARLGARAGWAFAFETGDGPHRADRDHLRPLWEGRTWIQVSDTKMDPPTVRAFVDGVWDWSYCEGSVHEQVRPDHPLTVRMTAEIGLDRAVPDPDYPDDPDECSLYIPPMAEVYRLFGLHYGLTLPREVIGDPAFTRNDLYGVFTAPAAGYEKGLSPGGS